MQHAEGSAQQVGPPVSKKSETQPSYQPNPVADELQCQLTRFQGTMDIPMIRANILIPSFHKNLRSYSCPLLKQSRPGSPKAPVSVSISPRGVTTPAPGISWRGGGNCGAGALIPPSVAFKSSMPPGSSITKVGHPRRFHFGRAPCRGSIRKPSSC